MIDAFALVGNIVSTVYPGETFAQRVAPRHNGNAAVIDLDYDPRDSKTGQTYDVVGTVTLFDKSLVDLNTKAAQVVQAITTASGPNIQQAWCGPIQNLPSDPDNGVLCAVNFEIRIIEN